MFELNADDGNPMRTMLVLFAVAGVALFGSLFALSWLSPITVEHAAREAIRYELHRRVEVQMQRLDDSALVDAAKQLLPGLDARIKRGQVLLNGRLDTMLDQAFTRMQNPSCECRRRMRETARALAEADAASAVTARDKLLDMIQTKYAQTAQKLMREFRIFTGGNAALFVLLTATAWSRRVPSRALVPAALTLFAALAFSALLYLVGQDWIHTLVFGQYVGYAYLLWLLLSALWFADLFANRARVSTTVLGTFGTAVGPPC